MADVLVRLDVQSEAYESKLKNATANLQHMEKEVRRVGATFEVADKEDLDFIKSLGSMETHATNASGKIKEMTQSIAEMTMVYNRMSDAEKNAATGQALAASIAQQKGNLAEFKDALADASSEAQKTGGFIDTLADGLGQLGPAGQTAAKLLKGAFGPVGIAIAAVVGVIHQVVEAFKRNEDAMASAERAAAPFKAMWQGIQRIFDKLVPLIADAIEGISNGIQKMFGKLTDWMGKLSNTSLGKKLGLDTVYEQMKKVQGAAGELTASNKKIADSERELHNLRRTSAEATARDEQKIAKLRAEAYDRDKYSAAERVKKLEEAADLEERIMQRDVALKQKELDVIKLKNSLTQSGTEDLDAQSAAQVALTNATTAYYNKQRQLQRQLQAAKNEDAKDKASASGGTSPADDSIAAQEKEVARLTELWKTAGKGVRDDYKKQLEEAQMVLNEMLGEGTGTSLQTIEFNAKGIAELKKQVSEAMSGATIGSKDYMLAADQLLDFTTFENILKAATERGVQPDPEWMASLFEDIKIGADVEPETWQAVVDHINELVEGTELPPITLDVKTGSIENAEKDVDKLKTNIEGAIGVFGQLGGAMQQLEEPGAKVAGIIMEAVATVAGSFAKSLMGAVGPWDWIAAAIGGVATMISTISAIKSVTSGSYASGGIVPGSSFSGDNLTANVNSGELILNRAQQGSIASQLQGAAQQTVMVEGRISGKDILLSANNTNRAAGGSRGYYTKVK